MPSKTPNFDKVLDEILKNLVPHERVCGQCKQPFKVEKEDIDFYNMLRVPPPALCPLCRKKRRFGHLMRMPRFSKKKCSVSGHLEEVISIFPSDSPHKIYDFDYYHSDAWDAANWAMDYDPQKPFFENFSSLFFNVPHLPLERDPKGINSEYTLGGRNSKDNYYSSMGYESQNTSYCFDARYDHDVFDCNLILHSELCYESVASGNCHGCVFVDFSENCLESSFLYDCKNCNNCFMSYNLRNKSYIFRNEQLTKEEYRRRIESVNLGDREQFIKFREEFGNFVKSALRRSVQNINAVNCIGDSISDSKNCYFSFRVDDCNNLRYAENHSSVTDSMDVTNSVHSEKLYECVVVLGSGNRFSMYLRDSTFNEYCVECYNSHYCFASVGLKNKRFHIFNRPYLENDYWAKVNEIKTAMLKRGEYGEFSPLNLGLMPYQFSNGQVNFPIDEPTSRNLGISWYQEPDSKIPIGAESASSLPNVINEANDDILNKVFICETSSRPYRFIPAELRFYKKINIPLPVYCPWERMKRRVIREHGLVLYPFVCKKCGENSYSVYSSEEQKELKVYCEKCYLKEVI